MLAPVSGDVDGSSRDWENAEQAIRRIATGKSDDLVEETALLCGTILRLFDKPSPQLGGLYCLWADFNDYLDAGEGLNAAQHAAVVELVTVAAQEWINVEAPWGERSDYFLRWDTFLSAVLPRLYA